MRIGELAARTGVSVRALRYYEEQDLLDAERSPSGQRHYPESAVDQVQLIQQLYAAGLSSRTIVELMPSVVGGRATPALLDRLAEERELVERRVTDLVHARARLDSVIADATSNMRTGASCGRGATA
ncbi:MerR family transcriptional regulator [[Kitasatospora] papulosa]|uniref:MerR family transcriptional regulator n=1 Tax=Streptomyces TaxID=1883 RepID=UPI0005609027|nr:MerR family transcriptional regulator [Streptomyces sp. NRRL S-325]